MKRRVWVTILLAALLGPQPVRADQTSIGVQLTGTHGTHRESDGTAVAPLIPVPIVTASQRFGCVELAAEGLPPMGPIHIANNPIGMQDISLTYLDTAVRYWNRTGTLAVGVGESLYNQRTNFARALDATHFGTELDSSRVAGTRYEITGRLPLHGGKELLATLGVDPSMHGRYSYVTHVHSNAQDVTFSSPSSWERASQVDANARFRDRIGDYAISYGVRYLNYVASYTQWPAPRFADANSLLMPYVGVQRFFGNEQSHVRAYNATTCVSRKWLPHVEAFVGAQIGTASHRAGLLRPNDGGITTPVFALRARRDRYELFAQGTPAVHAFSGTLRAASPQVTYSVAVGYATAGARYWLPSGKAGFGVGDALYDSRSSLSDGVQLAVRAAGLRYEALRTFALPSGAEVMLDAGVAPRMHERSTNWINGLNSSPYPSFGTGSLVDASATFETGERAGHRWMYGVRYLNYAGGSGKPRPFDFLKERAGLFTAFAAWGFTVGPR